METRQTVKVLNPTGQLADDYFYLRVLFFHLLMLLFTKYIHYVDECTVCYIDLGIHTTRGKDTGSDLRNTEVEGRNEETTG